MNLSQFVKDVALRTLSVGAATTAVVAACGVAESKGPLAPINAISHIVWGDEAYEQTGFSARYTAVGLLLNISAQAGWAVIYQLLAHEQRGSKALAGGAAVAALAYLVDYKLVPPRLTPGFEKHLSGRSLFVIYVLLAIALSYGNWKHDEGPQE